MIRKHVLKYVYYVSNMFENPSSIPTYESALDVGPYQADIPKTFKILVRSNSCVIHKEKKTTAVINI